MTFNKYKPNISALADGREFIDARINFNDSQIKEYQEKLIGSMKSNKNLKKQISELNKDVKVNNEEINKSFEAIELGYEDKKVHAYFIANQEDGVMEYYDQFGNQIHERKLRASERQENIMKLASNGN